MKRKLGGLQKGCGKGIYGGGEFGEGRRIDKEREEGRKFAAGRRKKGMALPEEGRLNLTN